MRNFSDTPTAIRNTADGNAINVVFTSATSVYLTAIGKFLYKGDAYYVSAHLYLHEDGTWGPLKGEDEFNIPKAPSISLSPKSVYGAIRLSIRNAFEAFITSTEGLRYRALGEQSRANNCIRTLDEKEAELLAELDKLRVTRRQELDIEAAALVGNIPSAYDVRA